MAEEIDMRRSIDFVPAADSDLQHQHFDVIVTANSVHLQKYVARSTDAPKTLSIHMIIPREIATELAMAILEGVTPDA